VTMRTIAMLSFAAAACLATPASATAPGFVDDYCSFSTVTDPRPEAPDTTQIAALSGGPIFQSGTITCVIQVGWNRHSDPDNATASATGTNGVTALAPTPVTYVSPPGYSVYLCDEFTDAGGTTYLFDDDDYRWEAAAGNSTAECRVVIRAGLPGEPLIPEVLYTWVDQRACPVLGLLDPVDVPGVVTVDSDGDLTVLDDDLWLCPPYES